ncbi:MAG: exodeoxyribonuclease VII large subunit [Oscillospiraceae bacterium]|nr:exodeoxyribonuclease VII large subunit [Oscillospiraceae bacterium]MCR4761069.1 exodeoxyribonuclease VII large subunit [Oscillospiraceae bacterium]
MSILTVSQLNRYVAFRLQEDERLRGILLRGEIANFTRNFRSGHCYFSLRDEEASVRAVMFRSHADRLPFDPENGMHVIVQGTVTLYERDGAYQVNVTDMQPDGVGAQALALQQRREKLSKLGYFAPERKRPVPPFPKKIGIVTSRSGAALQDMLQILQRRYPIGCVCIYPAVVQGEQAPQSVADALRTAGNDGCDLILMGRGGGSNEDLSAFQSEEVATAVFLSPVPVISAVGHETDHCIADEVADLRAPTPSAAAELAVPDLTEMSAALRALRERLDRAMSRILESSENALNAVQNRLQKQSPVHSIQMKTEQIAARSARLDHAVQQLLSQKEQSLMLLLNRIEAVSPIAVLQRGYALVYQNDTLVLDAAQLKSGDTLQIHFAKGSAFAAVTDIPEGESTHEI